MKEAIKTANKNLEIKKKQDEKAARKKAMEEGKAKM